jgi:diacylglycerol O-acyltransferase
MRRYSAARVHLADMKQVCRAFDVTLNDVALAAITNSYRTILLDRGEKPGPNSVRTLVAVSVRSVMLPLCRSTSPTRSSSWRWCTAGS